jgi:hypothetical protein
VITLRSIRATVDVWAESPSGSTRCAAVPFHELDLLLHCIGAAIQIARRGETASTPEATP